MSLFGPSTPAYGEPDTGPDKGAAGDPVQVPAGGPAGEERKDALARRCIEHEAQEGDERQGRKQDRYLGKPPHAAADDLGEERGKEDDRLRVPRRNEERPDEHGAQRQYGTGCAAILAGLHERGRPPRDDAEVDEVPRPQPPDDREHAFRHGQDRSQSRDGHGRLEQRGDDVARRRRHRPPRPVLHAVRQRKQHAGTGTDRSEEHGDCVEEPEFKGHGGGPFLVGEDS